MQFKTIQQILFFTILIAISLLFLWMIKGFILIIFWAIVLSILFNPLYKKILNLIPKSPSISSIITIFIAITIIFVPIFFTGSIATKESINYYQNFINSRNTVEVDGINILEKITLTTDNFLEKFGIESDTIESKINESINFATNWLANQVVSIGQNTFKFIVNIFVMIYILFFFLRDGKEILEKILHIMPLGEKRERKLIQRFVSTTRATIKGTFILAIIQGILGGILLWIVGIEAVILWAIVITILSVIPAVGPSLVYVPMGIVLLATGNIWQGVMLLVGGLMIVSPSDNLLRPRFVGKDAEMPDMLILLSTFGGISLFGITGFVIGPIITAFLLAIWHMFEEDNRENLIGQG